MLRPLRLKSVRIIPLLSLFAHFAFPIHAQLFGPESLGGAVLGGVAGGVIGHNNGRRTAEGAAIGAGVGAVLGAIVGNERRSTGNSYADAPPYPGTSAGPNRAVAGTVLGGIAGGVIGHNNGRRTAEGIAIGAGAGLLLGTLADQQAARRQALWATQPPVYVVNQPSTPPAPLPASTSQEPILLRPTGMPPAGSSMAGANSLFNR